MDVELLRFERRYIRYKRYSRKRRAPRIHSWRLQSRLLRMAIFASSPVVVGRVMKGLAMISCRRLLTLHFLLCAIPSTVLVAATVGCASARSQAINRSPDNYLSKNEPIPCKGVPITMKVPTHLDIAVMETYYLQNEACYENGDNNTKVQRYADLRELTMPTRNLSVKVTPVLTEQVFTVDFKRPMSGTLQYGATFGSDQYFDTITGTAVDSTITDVTALVAAAAPLFAVPTSAGTVGEGITNVIVGNRMVAYRRFDINEPDFEEQVLAFVNHHMNACNQCSGPTINSRIQPDPGVSSLYEEIQPVASQ